MFRIHPTKARRAFGQLRGLLLDLRDPEQPLIFAIATTDAEARSIQIEAETIVPCPLCGRGKAA